MPLTPSQARAEIETLVAQFRAQENILQNAPEAQIENDFIRPLFRALNWNVDNRDVSPAHAEFVLQKTERGKRPDYILRLQGNDLLVMDAKKVTHDMGDPRWLNQVYAYAYSTQGKDMPLSKKIDFAILTDFQEFVVLDCTLLAARPEAVANFRVLDWRYDEYVTRFDELWELFERDHVLAASRSRDAGLWARYLNPKKVKANRIAPDKAFLAALDDEKTGWRVRLAKDMKKHNPALGGEVLTAVTQLVIDRLMFIKVLSDREIEDDYLAQMAELVAAQDRDFSHEPLEMTKGARLEMTASVEMTTGSWFDACRAIFSKLNQIYNGSIFEPRPELEAVTVSNKVVREIINDLLPENSPYNFSVLPVEILGTIYERFLGRVVHATDKQVRIEDKPEVRKAGGVFYTPQYIVNYIVAQTVGKLLDECKTPDDVAQLKIVDPACGSGSFLLGAYNALIEWHEDFYADRFNVISSQASVILSGARNLAGQDRDFSQGRLEMTAAPNRDFSQARLEMTNVPKRDRDAAYYDADGRVRLTAKLKRQILLNNIFGVDIDPQAVEVTRLSLSLKALEDTRRAELYEEVDLFHQRVLPDLAHNIQCGNSLIGADYIFTDAAELKRVRPFEWERAFSSVFAPRPSRFPKTSKVLDARGFDAVIGNPPYIRIQALKEWAPLEVEIYKKKYAAAGAGNYDIYVVFVEKALALLNARGRMGFILPHKFFNSQYGKPLRQLIAQGKHLAHVVHFGAHQVFAGATTYTALLFLDKVGNESFEFVRVQDLQEWRDGKLQPHGTIENASVTSDEWNFNVGEGAELLERLRGMKLNLGNIADIFVGLQTSADDVFIMELREEKKDSLRLYSEALEKEWTFEKDLFFPLVSGTDVNRYAPLPERQYILFPYRVGESVMLIPFNEMANKYPETARYLQENKKRLESRENGKMKNAKWYGYIYLKNMARQSIEKLCVPRLVDRLYAAYDRDGKHFLDNVDVGGITLKKEFESQGLLYLLGLLNSRLLRWYFPSVSAPFRGGWLSANRQYIEQLPIHLINFSDPHDAARHEKMVALVERMLTLQQHRAAAVTQTDRDLFARQIEQTDRAIDELVYELYELNEQERAVVSGDPKGF